MRKLLNFAPGKWLGLVLSASVRRVRVSTDDSRLFALGGVRRGSFLAMVWAGTQACDKPESQVSAEEFIVLRVADSCGSVEEDGGCIELDCDVLGSFVYSKPVEKYVFAGDVSHVTSGSGFHVYMPDKDLIELVVNGALSPLQNIVFGRLRLGEAPGKETAGVEVRLSMLDIRGKRTAMFGKTRLGKSNAVKLIMQGMLEVTAAERNVGQLVFDVNGEYANDNSQDGGHSIASAYADRTIVFFLTRREGVTHGHYLRFNFYEQCHDTPAIFSELLDAGITETEQVRSLLSIRVPKLHVDWEEHYDQRILRLRKIFLFWTILYHAGFDVDEKRLVFEIGGVRPLNPGFSQELRMAAWQAMRGSPPPAFAWSFLDMAAEIKVISEFALSYQNDPSLRFNGVDLFDGDDLVMQRFLCPKSGIGPFILRPCASFHSPDACDFIDQTLRSLDQGDTVIVDLGSANERVIRYFARVLSMAVFRHQEARFVTNTLQGCFVQLYFEEAHMIFPRNQGDIIDVYSRFAKEGAKFHIGIVYSTQSPSSVNRDLLSQTENFFIGHLSSSEEVEVLANVQVGFKNQGADILGSRTPGFMRVLTFSHRYVVPVQAKRFELASAPPAHAVAPG